MFILTKSTLALMIGFILSTITGYFLIPLLKKLNIGQRISVFVGENHKKKNGVPTMGGLIFIIPTFITILIMYFTKKIDINNCSEVELTALPGISIVMSKKIIKKREEIGGFKNTNDFFLFLKLKPHMQKQLENLICVNKMKGLIKIEKNKERSVDL